MFCMRKFTEKNCDPLTTIVSSCALVNDHARKRIREFDLLLAALHCRVMNNIRTSFVRTRANGSCFTSDICDIGTRLR